MVSFRLNGLVKMDQFWPSRSSDFTPYKMLFSRLYYKVIQTITNITPGMLCYVRKDRICCITAVSLIRMFL